MRYDRVRARQALSTLGLLAAAWSVLLVLTQGVSFTIGTLHVSSHNARNPGIGALLLLALAALCAPAGGRAQAILDDLGAPFRRLGFEMPMLARAFQRVQHVTMRPQTFSLLAGILVALTLAASWTRGAYIAGGSDSYGYVSEAHLFATGRLRVDLPLAHTFPHAPARMQIPLGYRPSDDGSDTSVPVYAPGLPLTMALVERVGGMNAVYAVMPLLAAIAVWGAYRIGRLLANPAAGLGAALLVFASPAFLFQVMGAPMSDVPATGWWTLAVWLLVRDGRWSTAWAGVAAGLAILTRPNLLLVVVVLGAFLLWKVLAARAERAERIARLALFSLPVVLACLSIAALNNTWYGSPFRSGYGPGLFNAGYWKDNLALYPRWLTETQTPLLLAGFLAPFVIGWLPRSTALERRPAALMLVAVVLAVFASYLFYMPFGVWWYLRFLLPAFPMLAALTCACLAALSARFGRAARVASFAAIIGAAAFGLHYAKDMNALGEYRFRLIAEWARDHLPERAVILTMQHSGSVSHYAERPIVRYDLVAREDFEAALNDIVAAGYHPYLLVDEWEVPEVQRTHGTGPSGRLDWPPIALLPLGNVAVWDLGEDRDAARLSRRMPEMIPVPEFIRRWLP